jgi:hypothetical protein
MPLGAPLLTRQSSVESSRTAPRIPRAPSSGAAVRSRSNTASVVVAWRNTSADGAHELACTQVELSADLEASGATTWVPRQPAGSGWAEALSSARCSEVVLTAQTDDPPSKHLVFELAGLLTLELAATQPLIRVRFLPPNGTRRRARSAA